MKPPEQFTSARLILRKPRLEDAAGIFASYTQDPAVTRYLLWRPHTNIDETIAFLHLCIRNWEGERDFVWALESQSSGECIGMLDMRIEPTGVNLGYVLASRFWNQGFMSEAVRLVTEWALQQDGVFRVWAVCNTGNPASARVLEKAGMQCEGTLRRWIVFPNLGNEPGDCLCWSRVR